MRFDPHVALTGLVVAVILGLAAYAFLSWYADHKNKRDAEVASLTGKPLEGE